MLVDSHVFTVRRADQVPGCDEALLTYGMNSTEGCSATTNGMNTEGGSFGDD